LKLQVNTATNFILFDYHKNLSEYPTVVRIICTPINVQPVPDARRNAYILHAKRPIITKIGKCAKIRLSLPT